MQLKLRRSQRDRGVVSTSVVFCLDARADLSATERENLARYKLYDQVIYNSEASRRHLDRGQAASADGSVRGSLTQLAHVAMAAMRLNITVRSLERGQHIECKSLEELLAAEDAIMEACRTLRSYLETARTFDGSELVVDFSGKEPRVIAEAARPEPILAPPVTTLQTDPPLALPSSYESPTGAERGDTPYASYPSSEYQPTSGPIEALIEQISQITGLAERQARLLLIAAVVLVLVLLVALCRG